MPCTDLSLYLPVDFCYQSHVILVRSPSLTAILCPEMTFPSFKRRSPSPLNRTFLEMWLHSWENQRLSDNIISSINWNSWIQHQFSPQIFYYQSNMGIVPLSCLGLFLGAREKIQWEGWSSAGFLKDVLWCGCWLLHSFKDMSQLPPFVFSLEYPKSYWGYFLSLSQHSVSFLFLIFVANYDPPLPC